MGIWDRLENVIKSHINYRDADLFGGTSSKTKNSGSSRDPDLDAAYEELDDFLGGGNSNDNKWNAAFKQQENPTKKSMPEDIKEAFAELGLKPEASADDCKEAYKKLLKVHHPDRHAKHEGNLKKATAKTAKVNDAYERLMKWFKEMGNSA